jgi:CelD/BcsL family acetyltransferase involved in cellulose biosynthesis
VLRLEIDDPRWVDFVSASEDATPFHHPAWARLIAECYRFSVFALAVDDGAGRIVAGVPVVDVSNRLTGKRWVSLPYTDACSPLVASDGSVERLVAGLDEERRRNDIPKFELRADLPGIEKPLDLRAVIHTLPLTVDPEEMRRTFKQSVRQDIAKSHRMGVTVRRAETAGDLVDGFYGLHVRTRQRLGVPVQPRRYFVRLWERILEPGLGFCLLAQNGDSTIAGAVFLAWRSTVVYKYAASDRRFLGLRPNYALLWEAIRWSGANGYEAMDLGRTDLDHGGLRHFKRAWGAREEPLVYSKLGDNRGQEFSSRGASLLSPVIRHSPPSVCRAIGELLYRYAA